MSNWKKHQSDYYDALVSTSLIESPVVENHYGRFSGKDVRTFCNVDDAFYYIVDLINNNKLDLSNELTDFKRTTIGFDLVNHKTEKPLVSYTFDIKAREEFYGRNN